MISSLVGHTHLHVSAHLPDDFQFVFVGKDFKKLAGSCWLVHQNQKIVWNQPCPQHDTLGHQQLTQE